MKRLMIAAILLLVCSVASGECLLTTQTEAIPGFTVGEPANFQIVAVSGTEPYHFEIVEGELPEGLHLTSSGKIVGKPRVEADQPVLFNIRDAAGCELNITYNIVVNP